jgi:hypothetical protein
MTPTREERRPVSGLGLERPSLSALQRFADEVGRMFDDVGFGRRSAAPFWGETTSER